MFLLRQRPKTTELRDSELYTLLFPALERLLRSPCLPTNLGQPSSRFGLAQSEGDLLLRVIIGYLHRQYILHEILLKKLKLCLDQFKG